MSENQDNPVGNVSQVTPKKSNRRYLTRNNLYLLAGMLFIVLVMWLTPGAEKELQTAEESPSNGKELTLSQNLALLERMKASLQQKTNAQEQEAVRPPMLRSKTALSKDLVARMNAPTTFFNEEEGSGTSSPGVNNPAQGGLLTGNSNNVQFVNQQNDITTATAKQLPHPRLTVPAGEMIPATLETAIHSELPGMVRAITSRDIYSLEGENRLIPRGSTLVGQFNASVADGQSRILVVWNRVQLANGVIVTLNSPGTDSIGRAGQEADYINRHFFERFGTSALLSVLGAYTATSGVNGQDQYNSQSQYRMAIAGSLQQASGQTLQNDMMIRPTLQINQGAQIQVFVAHDLDFYRVGASHDV
ncbi:hypothetical protein Lrub_0698 [Legionella rubrilucens]|uniref:Conjugal transfer protein TrbI n=1 Tax=Legionella rubrilucens TaxID=458 RepID=A0A0W0XYR1_9GAMM|nr:TrbI/VirB10 family protein [Legionella rubrilucens]KTD49599.1 hypothetical protein Lrub_0698 [Legionella rubrilucens]